MLSGAQRQDFAAALLRAEETSDYILPLTESHPAADVDDAYHIAMAVKKAKLALGRTVRGHKVGFTSRAMRALTGATEPDFGTLFDDWFVPEASVIPQSRLNRPAAEIELAFVLRAPLDRPALNAADIIRATDFVLPAIEVVDSRYSARAPGGAVVNSIADAASCGLVVLGGNPLRLTDPPDIRRIGASLSRNGVIEETGVASAVMGNPINAVAWLANKLHEFGVPLEEGHVVLSGSFIKAVPFGPGDSLTALFDHFGEVTVAVDHGGT